MAADDDEEPTWLPLLKGGLEAAAAVTISFCSRNLTKSQSVRMQDFK